MNNKNFNEKIFYRLILYNLTVYLMSSYSFLILSFLVILFLHTSVLAFSFPLYSRPLFRCPTFRWPFYKVSTLLSILISSHKTRFSLLHSHSQFLSFIHRLPFRTTIIYCRFPETLESSHALCILAGLHHTPCSLAHAYSLNIIDSEKIV